MAYMRYEECAKWADTKNIIPNNINYRGEGYEEFKIEKEAFFLRKQILLL